jgi:hypothetical protein
MAKKEQGCGKFFGGFFNMEFKIKQRINVDSKKLDHHCTVFECNLTLGIGTRFSGSKNIIIMEMVITGNLTVSLIYLATWVH